MGRHSSVGMVTCYRLDGPGIKSRWGRNFPHLSRPALGVHPASCMVCTRSFQEVKLPNNGTDYPPHCNADLKERAELCLHSSLCAVMAGHIVNFSFTFSAFKIRCVRLNTCRVYSLIPVHTLFIISLLFVLNRSKLEGTVHTVTVIKYVCWVTKWFLLVGCNFKQLNSGH